MGVIFGPLGGHFFRKIFKKILKIFWVVRTLGGGSSQKTTPDWGQMFDILAIFWTDTILSMILGFFDKNTVKVRQKEVKKFRYAPGELLKNM